MVSNFSYEEKKNKREKFTSLASDFLDIKQDMKKGKSKKHRSNRGSKDAFEDKLDRDLLGGLDFLKH